MKNCVNKTLKILSGSIVALSAPSIFATTSCSKGDAIEFANYESYMSENLMNDLQSHYNIHFPNYTVAEMIPAKFEKFYDCAIPCGYELMALLRNDWLEKIDWSKFGVKDMSGKAVTDVLSARELFIPEYIYNGLEMMNSQFTQYIKDIRAKYPEDKLIKVLERDGTFVGDKFNILNYGVPYFAQSFMFAYTGDAIKFYHNNNGTPVEIISPQEPTWADIFYTISSANPKQDPRFKNKKIGMVDDARSFHDVSRIVETQELGQQPTLDPIEGASIDRIQETMSHVTSKFTHGSFVLNSDSAIVSRGLADRKGDQTAVLSWSGDTIYAAQGAEEFEAFTSKNFHIQKPSDCSFDEIEFVVINKKNKSNPTKLNNIYKVIKQVCLDGCDQDNEGICEKIESGERYKYWAMDNWNTIMYTPMLKSIYEVVVNSSSDYWQEQMEESGYDLETVNELFIPILNGAIPTMCTHSFGKTLTPLQNSNNHWAWLEQRGKL